MNRRNSRTTADSTLTSRARSERDLATDRTALAGLLGRALRRGMAALARH